MSDQSPPPAWYPDPSGRFELRYWNGTAWTEHAARGGEVVADPLQAATAPAAVAAAEQPAADTSQEPYDLLLPAGAVIACFTDRVPGELLRDGSLTGRAGRGSIHAFALTIDIWQLAERGVIRLQLADHRLRHDELVVLIDNLARFDASRDCFDEPVRSFLAALRTRAVAQDGALEPQSSTGWINALLYDTDAASFSLELTYDATLGRAGVLTSPPDQKHFWEPTRRAALEPEFDRLLTGWRTFEAQQPALAHALHHQVATSLKNRWWSD